MAKKLRSLKKAARKSGLARGLFKKAGDKLNLPKRLANPGTRAPKPPSRKVPPTVQRLPSGRYPANAKDWTGKVYNGKRWTDELRRKYPNGVRFTDDGYPDFSPYVLRNKDGVPYQMVFTNGFRGRDFDAPDANRKFGLPKLREDYVWHHHQDGKTLMAVPKDMHDAIRHAGGIARMGE
jgi:hypothetical protein